MINETPPDPSQAKLLVPPAAPNPADLARGMELSKALADSWKQPPSPDPQRAKPVVCKYCRQQIQQGPQGYWWHVAGGNSQCFAQGTFAEPSPPDPRDARVAQLEADLADARRAGLTWVPVDRETPYEEANGRLLLLVENPVSGASLVDAARFDGEKWQWADGQPLDPAWVPVRWAMLPEGPDVLAALKAKGAVK